MKETKKRNPLVKLVLRIVVFFLIITGIALSVLTAGYLINIKQPQSFIPPKFMVYIEVPSLKTVYDDWINLEAADIALSTKEMSSIRKALTDFRGQGFAKNPLFRELLNIRADIVVGNDGNAVAVFDLGWRSVLTRSLPILGPNLNVKNMTVIRKNSHVYFQYNSGTNSTLYLTLADNLLLLSPSLASLEASIARSSSGDNLLLKGDKELLEKMRNANGKTLRLLADTGEIVSTASGGNNAARAIIQNLNFSRETLITSRLDNQNFQLDLDAFPDSSNEIIKKLLSNHPDTLGVLDKLPFETYLISAFNLGDFKDLYRLAVLVSGSKLEDNYKKADDAAKNFMGMGLDDLIFSWTGSEAGFYSAGESSDPVFFCKIKDRSKFDIAINKIKNTLALGEESSDITVDEVVLSRIQLPDYLQGIIQTFGVNIPVPYYVVEDGYLFLSLNAELLSKSIDSVRKDSLLTSREDFKKLSASASGNPGLFLYYNLDRSTPFFLDNNSLPSQILKLYGEGIASITPLNGEWTLNITARKTEKTGVKLFPGFPVSAGGNLSGDVWVTGLGGISPCFVFVRNGKELVSADPSLTGISSTNLDDGITIIPQLIDNSFFVWSPQGNVFRLDRKLRPIDPFPRNIDFSKPPVWLDNRLAGYSVKEKKIEFVGIDGSVSPFPWVLPAPLLSPPALRSGFWAFYPKSFEGKVYLCDDTGALQPGWPVSIQGLSYGSPVLIQKGNQTIVVLLTQAGILYAWDETGKSLSGFPFKLEGVYYQNPVILPTDSGEALLTLSEEGTLRIISLEPKILQERKLDDLNGKEANIALIDIHSNGNPEIFLYGDRNRIFGLTVKLNDIPGFPVKGNTRPNFYDLNQDGKIELITGTVDNKIAAYTLEN